MRGLQQPPGREPRERRRCDVPSAAQPAFLDGVQARTTTRLRPPDLAA